jgi:hypothetical protein
VYNFSIVGHSFQPHHDVAFGVTAGRDAEGFDGVGRDA